MCEVGVDELRRLRGALEKAAWMIGVLVGA